MHHLGKVGGAGSVRVTLTPVRAGTVPHRAVGCLDRARLDSAVAELKRTGASAVHVTDHGVRAELPPGTTGTVVLAAPRIAGWSCQGRPADSYLGLVATPAASPGRIRRLHVPAPGAAGGRGGRGGRARGAGARRGGARVPATTGRGNRAARARPGSAGGRGPGARQRLTGPGVNA